MGTDAPYEEREIELAGTIVAYRLRRGKRRTITLTVEPDQGLVVHCPRRYARWRVEEMMRGKARWILNKTREVARRNSRRKSLHWRQGGLLPFQGRDYPLRVRFHRPGEKEERQRGGHGGEHSDEQPDRHGDGRRASRSGGLWLAEGWLHLMLPEREVALPGAERLRELVLEGYKSLAREAIGEKVASMQERLGVQPGTIRIKSQKRRWGSCSAKGGLNFNWRLILAPPAVLEYVVVHELCHLLHLNHSPRFWARLAEVLPDYRERQAWLREHGAALYIDALPIPVTNTAPIAGRTEPELHGAALPEDLRPATLPPLQLELL